MTTHQPEAPGPHHREGFLRPLADRSRPVGRRTALLAGGASLAALGVTTAITAPRSAVLGERGGDLDLASEAAEYLAGHRAVHLSVLTADSERVATFGPAVGFEYEIGSVTKTMTSALLVQSVEQREVALETTVAEILADSAEFADALEGSQISDVTLRELSAHTSGLPRLVDLDGLATFTDSLLRRDPYHRTPREHIAACLASPVSGRGEFAYSNAGVGLLGQLLAIRLGGAYEDLLTERVLRPLGMTETRCATTRAQLGDGFTRGHTVNGFASAPWTMGGEAPAGAVRSTVTDMSRYVQGLLTGETPALLDPVVERNDRASQAVGWSLLHLDEGEIAWHNGMTGGFASFCGINQSTGRGVAVLTDTAQPVEEVGMMVLAGEVGA